jgi:peptide/nickel transport system ATP-binding protein
VTGAGPLLQATDLVKEYPVRHRVLGRATGPKVHAVNGVSLEVRTGETLGVVGESGCGKSTLARLLARLDEVTAGSIRFQGQDITALSRRALRSVRADVQMVFQDPYSSLNPRRRIGDIVAEPLRVHHYGDATAIRLRVAELLEMVGLSADHAVRYPREFSGGQRQRIGIARALAPGPKLIIADEPVSALDMSIQAQVLNLFTSLQRELDLTCVFIAHDLGVVRHVSDRVAVMYLGAVVELSARDPLYATPAHPYTEALLSAVPDIDDGENATPRERIVLTGELPSPIDLPIGCAFAPRCRYARGRCREEKPALRQITPDHAVACHFPLSHGPGDG